MITVGGFNTSLDTALEADELALGAVNRVRSARSWPGGKGLHVAVAAAALGEPVRLVGLIDAAHRREFEDVLGERGVEFQGVETSGRLRTCLAVRDRGGARITEILEPGPELDERTRQALRERFQAEAARSDVAVLSGSLPGGFEASTYGDLVRAAREAGVRCLVDASGELLRQAVDACPYLVKPNREEAEALTGQIVDGPAAAARTARALAGRGVGVAVISLGGDGAVAAQGDRAWYGWVELPRVANPVGSGDCLLGGLAVALARGMDPASALRLGVACGSANALSPETGWVQRADIDALLPRVQVREA